MSEAMENVTENAVKAGETKAEKFILSSVRENTLLDIMAGVICPVTAHIAMDDKALSA